MDLNISDVEEVKKEVVAESKLPDTKVAVIEEKAKEQAKEIMALDIDKIEEKRQCIKTIEVFAVDTMAASARKNTLLQTTIGNLSKSGGEGGTVSTSLAELHRNIKDLDPSVIDFTKTGILGKIFNPVRRYFEKYDKADNVIKDIIVSLDKGKATLKNDNTTLDIEEDALRETTKKLNTELALGSQLDAEVTRLLEKAEADDVDPEKVRFVTEEILFPLRQRIMDMQQMVAVNQQGIIAIEIIKRNNKELIRGVDRAKTVTISALRTAVMVASALYNQKIVLKKIEMLNETTAGIISSTSRMLKEQGAAIQKQATEATVSPDTLKQAFQDCLSALEDISTFKRQALPKMAETVNQFKLLAEQGEKEITRLEKIKGE